MKYRKIERLLFWFKDGDRDLTTLNDQFFGLAILLTRLLNEIYIGKKIKFINIDFASDEKYRIFPQIPKNFVHYYGGGGGHLRFYGELDFLEFDSLNEKEQKFCIWEKACSYMRLASNTIKNSSLLEATNYAYHKGLANKLNTDYRVLEENIILYNQLIHAYVYIEFKSDSMVSKLVLEKRGIIILEKEIDSAQIGSEFFLEIYKKIEVRENKVIVKIHREVNYLPFYVLVDKHLIIIS